VLGELSRLDNIRNVAASVVKTPAQFTIAHYPRSTLFQTIIDNVENGGSAPEDSGDFFDPSTCNKYIPFVRSTKASSNVNLMLGLQIFVTVLTGLKKEPPQVYFRLTKEIAKVITSHGFKAAHKYLDALLRNLDEGVSPNIVELFRRGEHYRILQDFDAVRRKAEMEAREATGRVGYPKLSFNFGELLKPLDGSDEAFITGYEARAPEPDLRLRGVPQEECSAGVPVRHPNIKKGWGNFKRWKDGPVVLPTQRSKSVASGARPSDVHLPSVDWGKRLETYAEHVPMVGVSTLEGYNLNLASSRHQRRP